MSGEISQEELQKLMEAASMVDRVFTLDKRGKYLRPLAKRVSDMTEMTYEQALDLLYKACAGALLHRFAGDAQ